MNAPSLSILAPVTGRLLGWAGSPVRVVTAGELLGEVESADGARHELRAPLAGSFWAGANRGAAVEAGAELATLRPTAPLADAPRAAVRVESMGGKGSAPPAPPRPTAPPVARHVERPEAPPAPPIVAPPIVEELTMPPARKRAPLAPAAPPKLERKTYYLTDDQQRRIRELSHDLKASGAGGGAGESEILRAAVELLLELPRPALVATLKANLERERAGKYGRGYPRPGNPNIGEISKQISKRRGGR